MISIHPATYKNVFDIYNIQCLNYSEPSFWESRAFIHHVVSAGLSFVAKKDDNVIGYIMCHYLIDPSNPPRLNGRIPNHGNHLFIHDTCVKNEFHLLGIASKLVEAVHNLAVQKNIQSMYIIAVKDSHPFWIKRGYKHIDIHTIWDYRSQYQEKASYMHRIIASKEKGVQ